MDKQNTTPPDMIAQAGELLRRFQRGADLVDWDDLTMTLEACTTGESAIVIASAVLAVAGELRELRNVLADGLLSQLVQADADNAALIERLHSYEPIEVPE